MFVTDAFFRERPSFFSADWTVLRAALLLCFHARSQSLCGMQDDDDDDLFDKTIKLVHSMDDTNVSNVSFNVCDVLGDDSTVNESRVLALEQLARSWGGTVQPVVVTKALATAPTITDKTMDVEADADTGAKKFFKRPPGAPQKNKKWCYQTGIWVFKDETDTICKTRKKTSYAIGSFNYGDMWFVVKELDRRKKKPHIKVKFLSRLDGTKIASILPSPTVDWVDKITTIRPSVEVS